MKPLYWLLAAAVICICAVGCSKSKATKVTQANIAPLVKVDTPKLRDIHRLIDQPGTIEPYERTAIFSKISGFVQKWRVDIGAKVKKGDLLIELMVPELADELAQKAAQVERAKAVEQQSVKLVAVAESNVQAAQDAVVEARANIKRYQADLERWRGEMNRLSGVAKDGIVNPEVLADIQNQLKSTQATIEAARAAVKTKESQRIAAEAQVDKAKADLAGSKADVKVAEADEQRLASMLQYTKITAPYDGVVTSRNVNTGDFVRAGAGNAAESSGSDGSGSQALPLLTVTRTDPMVFVIGVPEVDAPYVTVGSKASLRLQALAGREFDVSIRRIAPTLHKQSRTLLAEIDLPNTNGELLPGMYAYGSIELNRTHVRAIPSSATVQIGNRTCCYLVDAGKVARIELQTGVSDGAWVEVRKKAAYPGKGDPGAWENFNGAEKVIVGDISEITDGQQVVLNDVPHIEEPQVTGNKVARHVYKTAVTP